MKMKKALALIGALSLTVCVKASAKNAEITVPDYDCEINLSSVYYKDQLYPLISYNDVTYFPMTYEYSQSLNLTSSWVEGKGLYVAYQPSYDRENKLPVYKGDKDINSSSEFSAVIPDYPIYINGKLFSDKENFPDNEKYPLINFRDVTYFPMTWDMAHDEFSWETNWDNEKRKFTLNSNVWNAPPVDYLYKEDTYAVLGDFSDNKVTYKKYDFKDESIKDLAPDQVKSEKEFLFHKDVVETSVKDGKFIFENNPVPGVRVYTKEEIEKQSKKTLESFKNTSRGFKYKSGEVTLFDFISGYEASGKDKTGIKDETSYTYALYKDKLLYVGENVNVSNGYIVGDFIYINTRKEVYNINTYTSKAYTLLKITPEGKQENITESFENYNSMYIADAKGNTLYIRAAWCEGADKNIAGDSYVVSPVNDGYFTYDTKTGELTKKANYTYADETIVDNEGNFHVFTMWDGKMRKLDNINQDK